MRRTACLLAAAVLLAGCSSLKKTFGLKDTTPAHVEPRSTSIYGSWMLSTPSDSTAFAGAQSVELSLAPGTFTITALYPTRSPIVVRGNATLTETGLLTLTPTELGAGLGTSGALVMAQGHPYTMLTSAAGNTLVFAPPSSASPVPSSVWHKKAAAQAAGTTKADSTR